MDLTITQLVLTAVLVFAGAIVQGVAGFGLAIVAAPLLALIHPEFVPGPVLCFAMVSAALNAWAYRKDLALGELTIALIARIPGTLLAMAVLLVASPAILSIMVGLSVLAAVGLSIRMPLIERSSKVMFIAGFMSAFMGTTTAIGGPPMALAYQSATGAQARANMGGYTLLGMATSLLALLVIGRFTRDQFIITLVMIVPVLLGFRLATIVAPLIRPIWLRRSLLVLCSVSAAAALAKGGFELFF